MASTWYDPALDRDRAFVLAASVFMIGGNIIVFALGDPPALFGLLLILAPLCALRSAFGAVRGTSVGFGLLWAAFGSALGLGIVGAFSFGVIYLMAVPFLLAAIATTPNRTARRRWAFRYIGVQLAAFLAAMSAVVIG